jgi:hypothetical protein
VTPDRRFSTGRSLLYGAIVCAAFFALVEAGLRLVGIRAAVPPRLILRAIDTDIDLPFMRADAELFWAPRPGWRGEFMGTRVSINDLGLRGPALEPAKRPGRLRLVCFGDSITFGYGAGDEATYPFLLERALARSGVEVVNAGVTGYTSHQVLGLSRRLAPELEPDVVSVMIG